MESDEEIESAEDVEIRPELSRRYLYITLSPKPTVSKIESKFRESSDVKDLPKSGRPKITQDKKIDNVLSTEENPQTSTLVASENEVSQTTVLRILRKENYHP
ncbi:hypothetical protein NQ318_003906 [Aromia moschata]|uniref:HTH psq-type domain-containing protein n=1 Tax=Aromia moschata TaxID=1265417 RepID=A0AAV8Z7C0_9CUCU|nr:hypothetical protein NQ318_003906 [Aromia moschata]